MNEAVSIPYDRRPIVRARQNSWAPWAFAILSLAGAALLYNSLETARAARTGDLENSSTVDVAPARPLPELVVPQLGEPVPISAPRYDTRPAVRLFATPTMTAQPRTIIYRSPPVTSISSPPSPPQNYNYVPPPPTQFSSPETNAPDSTKIAGRTVAQRLSNPSYTVVEGSLIPAVLETALDSTRAGPARAMVSRDVRSFDRQRVLIPRGSKLIGEYQSDFSGGQNRAAVIWTRLIRPDGGTIELRSPSADGLGRTGIRGKINNHTMQRVGDALLQTMVGIGSGLTQRAVTQQIIVVPGGAQPPMINMGGGGNIQPTLTVPQGARVTVFVARDLDFSEVDQTQ